MAHKIMTIQGNMWFVLSNESYGPDTVPDAKYTPIFWILGSHSVIEGADIQANKLNKKSW